MTPNQRKFNSLSERYKKAFEKINGYKIETWYINGYVWVYQSEWNLPLSYCLIAFEKMTESLEKNKLSK